MKRAFTLAELLMAVLVISIIMVALAPVITRRAYDNISIEVNKKKGLEIFTNPGTYTFDVPIGINTLFISGSGGGGGGAGATFIDKTVSYTSNTTWTVPQGVNQLTFTITGAGGGGGAGSGAASPSTNSRNPHVYNNKCLGDEFLAIRGASTEEDLCITKKNIVDGTIALNTRCDSINCCWEADKGGGYCAPPRSGSAASGCGRPVCMYNGASSVCTWYQSYSNRDYTGTYRLPNVSEGKKILKYLDDWSTNAGSNGLQFCSYWDNYNCPDEPLSVPRCQSHGGCIGMEAGNCSSHTIWLEGGGRFDWGGSCRRYTVDSSSNHAAGARCVRPLTRYTRYSASGGSSGAQLTKTINVLPSDKLEITIGNGGAGGTYNTSRNNGISSRNGNGARGSDTKIIHKRGTTTLGTYYVKGGMGGYGATTTSHGAAIANGSSSGQTTPQGTCYANGNIGCTTLSYQGTQGTSNHGGSGGRVKNTGTINDGGASSGGYLYIDSARTANQRNTTNEANKAKGQNASINGFGGGGGLTPSWVTSSSHFYQGGNGAKGKIDITYRVALPGGGGGAAGSAGNNTTLNTDSELSYKVEEGSRIVFSVGSGGDGGSEQQMGSNGTDTIIGDNDIIFYGGKGGRVSTTEEKNSLLGGSGGQGQGVKYKGSIINKGEDGKRGQYKINGVYQNYGFDGGVGAKTFLQYQGGCGGGIIKNTNDTYNCITSASAKGLEAKSHDPINNKHGGAGGGGGGVIQNSLNLGSGGNGASGYVRIRWDESENE